MNELIARISSLNDYVEIAQKENEEAPVFKKIDKEKFIEIVNSTFYSNNNYHKNLKLLDPQIIAIDEHYAVIKQEGKKRIINYNDGKENHVYKINFPNAIYIVEFEKVVRSIECYAYIEYAGEETQLYEYPMPNELMGNKMCMGSADKSIKEGNIVEALERIIFTPYSHASFSGMNGFSKTKVYFNYLEKNEFPYKMMRPLKKKLKDVLKG